MMWRCRWPDQIPAFLAFAFHLGCSRALYEPELNLIEVFASVSLPRFFENGSTQRLLSFTAFNVAATAFAWKAEKLFAPGWTLIAPTMPTQTSFRTTVIRQRAVSVESKNPNHSLH
jgi:hypothetical protein